MGQISMPKNIGSRNICWSVGGYGFPPVVNWTHTWVFVTFCAA